MPPKKSMKSVSATEVKAVSRNIFSALSEDDEILNTHQETLQETLQETIQETIQEKMESLDNEQIRKGNMVVADINQNTLNGTDKINLAEFVSNIKQRREGRDNRDNRDNREGREGREGRESRYRNVRSDEKMLENKQLYDETAENINMGNELKFNSHWTVWVHKSDNQDWTLHGYQKRYIINSIGTFWRFFNNFQFYDCYKNQLFIMRGEIAPIWEDINNKFGGICSIKVDSTQRGFKTDISTEIFISICMLIMNETFIVNNEDINGISYAVKKKNILIKIWTKSFYENDKFKDELPKTLINKFNSELQKQLVNIFGPDYKMSVQYKQIKPEYEI